MQMQDDAPTAHRDREAEGGLVRYLSVSPSFRTNIVR